MPKVHKIPLIGDIACGTPVLAVKNIEDEVFSPDDIHDKAQQMITLIAENPLIPPRIYQGEALDHIRVLGLAVGLTRNL